MRTGHEHLFHILLGIMGIQTNYYIPSLDLSSSQIRPYSGPQPSKGEINNLDA